ncbi:MAG: hypothetical protein GXY83_12320 [Rhodopirellula sp.]|nr:hypothetical protein [Rhodopirellula sp.]
MKLQHVERLPDTPNPGRSVRRLAASATLCVLVSVCYWWQPDWLAPVTLVPAWFWLVPAFTLLAFEFSRTHKRWCVAVAAFWVVYAALMVEEVQSLVRSGSRPTSEWQAARASGRAIRVVSLNCAAANRAVTAELAKWEPDIVLLQESPGREHVDCTSRELFGTDGGFLWSSDTSIIARGDVRPRNVDRDSHFVHAQVELPTGLKADVMSVRLDPPVFRLDFWMPGFWIDHRNRRLKHRRQIREIMQRVENIEQAGPLIVGGDFNAPPGDPALVPLERRLYDSFRKAGRGWGNTGTSAVPLFRVDQIWVSPHLRAESVTAQKTLHSDHRMVVCDLALTWTTKPVSITKRTQAWRRKP